MKSAANMTREELEEEVAYLRHELGIARDEAEESRLASAYGLTGAESRVLLAIYQTRGVVASYRLEEVIAGSPGPAYSDGIVQVYICKVRRKIGAASIETVRSRGYRLADAARLHFDHLLLPASEAA